MPRRRASALTNTHFVNATGLSHPQHYSTAADLARLAAALIRDFPEYYPLYSLREYRYNNITQPNRNRLLWIDPYVDGMKTGHTDAAGWCLVASAKRGERRLLAVVLGAASDAARTSDAQKLLNYGFQAFDTVQLYSSGQPVSSLARLEGREPRRRGGLRRGPVPDAAEGQGRQARADDDRDRAAAWRRSSRVSALGTVKVSLDGKRDGRVPARRAGRRSGWRTSSAARGIRCGSGSSSGSTAPAFRRQRHDRLPQRPVPADRGSEDLRPRPRLHLRRRRLRAHSGLPATAVPACRSTSSRLQHSLDGIRLANPHTDAEWTCDHRRARRAAAVRRSGRLPPGDARRREARPHVSGRRRRRPCS